MSSLIRLRLFGPGVARSPEGKTKEQSVSASDLSAKFTRRAPLSVKRPWFVIVTERPRKLYGARLINRLSLVSFRRARRPLLRFIGSFMGPALREEERKRDA